jgi:hypothetical protein
VVPAPAAYELAAMRYLAVGLLLTVCGRIPAIVNWKSSSPQTEAKKVYVAAFAKTLLDECKSMPQEQRFREHKSRILRTLIERCPETPEAREAKKLLEELLKDHPGKR